MIKKRIARSLSLQLLCRALSSILIAVISYVVLIAATFILLDHTVYGETFQGKMADRYFSALQEYVEENDIAGKDLDRLDEWFRQRKAHTYLAIYQDDQQIYNSVLNPARRHLFLRSSASAAQGGELLELEDERREYTLTLADGTSLRAFLYYYAGDIYYYGAMCLFALAAFVIFSLHFVGYVRRKLLYIKEMKEGVDVLAGGEWGQPIRVSGQDELGELAFGINQMRRSILTHQAMEEEARSGNSKLVTAISHDLRTPLTSLLAYLELLDREKYDGPEQQKYFVKRSLGQAMRIKNMADQLFEYVLVYSSEWEEPDLETADADELFRQICGEYAFSLESQQYTVEMETSPIQGTILVNLEMLHRVFDNLYSNLLKYADITHPIHFRLRREGNCVFVELENVISSERSVRESTNIGLNTCRRIMKYHSGGFEVSEQERVYRVRLSFPTEEIPK